MWLCTLLVHTPHTIQVWGIVSFIIAGFYHNLHFDKRKSTPHFLFILTSRIGVGRTNYHIYIGDNIERIGDNIFRECESLTSVYIPNSVTEIGASAFTYCSSLESITIPNSVTTIGDWAFCICDSLTSVTIPNSVTTIGHDAFNWCDNLRTVYCEAITPPIVGSEVFNNNAGYRIIYVPTIAVAAYQAADGWSDYADYIVGYDF